MLGSVAASALFTEESGNWKLIRPKANRASLVIVGLIIQT